MRVRDRIELQVCAECQQAAVAILHDKLARVPWHVGKAPRELDTSTGVLFEEGIRIFDEQIRIKQFGGIFVRIGCGRWRAPKVNCVLVACHDGVDWRILPSSQTLEAKLVFVIGERSWNIGGEELRGDLTEQIKFYRR